MKRVTSSCPLTQFKYVFNGFDFDELYDLEADPAYAGILRQMATRIWPRIHKTGGFDLIHSHYGMFRYAPVGPG